MTLHLGHFLTRELLVRIHLRSRHRSLKRWKMRHLIVLGTLGTFKRLKMGNSLPLPEAGVLQAVPRHLMIQDRKTRAMPMILSVRMPLRMGSGCHQGDDDQEAQDPIMYMVKQVERNIVCVWHGCNG